MTAPRPIVDVAVGLIIRHGQALIAWRDAARHQGGRYEFSGGKVDAGETPAQALIRELDEELAIEVTQLRFLQRLRYDYADKTVCLHVYQVDDFVGEPMGKEGQPLRWVAVDQLSDFHFPDANAPIVRAAQLPCHYIVSPDCQINHLMWLDEMYQCVPINAWLYLRLPSVSHAMQLDILKHWSVARPDVHLIAAAALQDECREQGVRCRGFHLKQQQLMQRDQLERDDPMQYWFAACHDAVSIAQAERLGVDGMVVGAVNATPTHPNQAGLGWQGFAQLIAGCARPVYALGGVGPTDWAHAQALGAWGVAGIRGFLA
jgi:8-oxo-dGTP diphosphatase